MAARKTDVEALKEAILQDWPKTPGKKARPYVNAFFDRVRTRRKIVAKVEGNHGTYTVSIHASGRTTDSACSCYIGGGGGCHHCHALGLTFLRDPDSFQVVRQKRRTDVHTISDLSAYLKGVTLDSLIQKLKDQGITQKAFAEGIGMNTRHLSAIKSSELRNRYFNELGATKLACLWVLEHCKEGK